MQTTETITELLKGVIHPEQQRDIVTLGMVENLSVSPEGVRLTLRLTKPRDPMASSLRRAIEGTISAATGITPVVIVAEPVVQSPKAAHQQAVRKQGATNNIGRVIAIASGKGGVGKSTVAANLAIALAARGLRVGLLDVDIYGPSMPKMFGLEDYKPTAEVAEDGSDIELINPAESHGVKIMSIGFFVSPNDAMVWRGPMATSALKQLLHQTAWGELDFLLLDLPPGTGDLHLTIVSELSIDGAIVVSTPAQVAQMDVVRGIAMFRNENVNVPILGLVENMAWFTPEELPDNRYYIFGPRGAVEALAAREGVPLLAQIPIVESIASGGDNGAPIALEGSAAAAPFVALAETLACG